MVQVVIRVDGSSKIGSGHVMRCLALGRALRTQLWQVHFVCKELAGHYCDVIQQAGFALSKISAHPGSLEVNWLEDAAQTLVAINADVCEAVDWLVLDHYMLTQEWEQALRPHVSRVLVIDDFGNRHHDCDVLLDQNVLPGTVNRYEACTSQNCKHLLGPEYALLQPVYQQARQHIRPRTGSIKRILIFFGGVDSANMTEKAVDAFLELQRQDIAVDLVLGSNYLHQDAVRRKVQGCSNIHIHVGLPDLADLMRVADLAIGAGGVTHWERMCLGLPSVVVSLSANQTPVNESLSNLGLVKLLGHHSAVTVSQISQVLNELVRSGLAPDWSQRCMELVDGRGALRVWAAMEQRVAEALVARDVSLEDEHLLLLWANDPVTRQNAFSTDPIPKSVHASWLRRKLGDPSSTKFYIVQTQNGALLGQVRFDWQEGNVWEIDYAVNPSMRGLGWGCPMLRVALQRLRYAVPTAAVRAHVKTGNQASCRVFESLGFQRAELVGGAVEFKLLNVDA